MKTLITLGCVLVLSAGLLQAEELVKPGNRHVHVMKYGKEMADSLKKVLKSNLQEQMKKNGPVKSVVFCSEKAMELTHQVNQYAKKGLMVKRVSEKFRNPANAPDKMDKIAFEFFKQKKEHDGQYPSEFIARQSYKENPNIEIFRYYEPLIIQKPCLACHGEKIKPEVMAEIKSRYPDDMATGYKLGELRGLIAVQVTPDALVIKQ